MIFSINKDREKYRLRKTRIKILESVLYYRSSLCIPKGVLCKARDHKFVCLHKPLPAPGFMWLITCLVRSGQCPHLIPALYGTGFARSIFRAGASPDQELRGHTPAHVFALLLWLTHCKRREPFYKWEWRSILSKYPPLWSEFRSGIVHKIITWHSNNGSVIKKIDILTTIDMLAIIWLEMRYVIWDFGKMSEE